MTPTKEATYMTADDRAFASNLIDWIEDEVDETAAIELRLDLVNARSDAAVEEVLEAVEELLDSEGYDAEDIDRIGTADSTGR